MSINKITSTTYEKTLSQSEVLNKQIIIVKQALKLFPKPWKDFTLYVGKEKLTTHIESISCTCTGIQMPHQHYLLRDENLIKQLNLKPNLGIKFQKLNDKEYQLEQTLQ